MTKVAVVLCNLGGPDSLESVKPFLRNMFADPAILPLSQPFRWLLGTWIVFRRSKAALDNYRRLGGKSPLLSATEAQAEALQTRLEGRHEDWTVRTFVAMRYWCPEASEVVGEVKAWKPDHVVILPLYPHYSTTTTESSLLVWQEEAKRQGLDCPHVAVCCYPTQTGWVHAVASTIETALIGYDLAQTRVIFSAHGLPQSIVDAGDPYPTHISATVNAVVEALHLDGLDWTLAYQSRVGPQKWIEPYLEDALSEAANDGKTVVVVPIAFVSEHSETLVELDIEYAELAKEMGCPDFIRTPTVNCDPHFIGGLANLVEQALQKADGGSGFVRFGLETCAECTLPQRACAKRVDA